MIIASNLKTNHTRESFSAYMDTVKNFDTTHQIRIFPPSTAFITQDLPMHVKVGAQNFYPIQNGSFTGEIGAEQLEEFYLTSVLIGHSERRHILGENDELIVEKFNFAMKKNWEIIFCIGEPKEVWEQGESAVLSYLQKQLNGVDLAYKNLIIAYEPVWAIGTGVVAKVEDIKSILNTLKQTIKAPLLYGGSVKPNNVREIYELENCDGVLVGTAAWEAKSFYKIIEEAN